MGGMDTRGYFLLPRRQGPPNRRYLPSERYGLLNSTQQTVRQTSRTAGRRFNVPDNLERTGGRRDGTLLFGSGNIIIYLSALDFSCEDHYSSEGAEKSEDRKFRGASGPRRRCCKGIYSDQCLDVRCCKGIHPDQWLDVYFGNGGGIFKRENGLLQAPSLPPHRL